MEFGEFAEWVRGRLLDFLPDWLDFIPATWPDWALILAAPIVIVVLIGLALRKEFNTFKESKKGFQVAGRHLTVKSIFRLEAELQQTETLSNRGQRTARRHAGRGGRGGRGASTPSGRATSKALMVWAMRA